MGRKNINKSEIALRWYLAGEKEIWNKNPEKAEQSLQKAVLLAKHAGDDELYAKTQNLLGVTYSISGNDTMSMDCYLEGLAVAKEKNLKHLFSLFYNNIGSRYQELGAHEKAVFYFEKAWNALISSNYNEKNKYLKLCMILHLNMGSSYGYLGENKKSEQHLLAANRIMNVVDELQIYCFTAEYLLSQLYWKLGKKDYAYQKLDSLLDMAENREVFSDYYQDIKEFNKLLYLMEEYEALDKAIGFFEKYAEEQNKIHLRLKAVEMRMDYFQAIGNKRGYEKLCIQHTELYFKRAEELNQDQIHMTDIKINYRQKEGLWKKILKKNEYFKQRSERDALTGLSNRYSMEEYGKRFILKARQEKRKITAGVIDIDFFKEYNDNYGHIKGDECLNAIAQIIGAVAGNYGRSFRYGGDEFVILLNSGDKTLIGNIAEEIHRRTKELALFHKYSHISDYVTISQGYIVLNPYKQLTLNQLIQKADQVLYEIKKTSRDGFKVTEHIDYTEKIR